MAEGKCTSDEIQDYTGPVCPPGETIAIDHTSCIEDIRSPDNVDEVSIDDLPDLPDDVTAPEAPTVEDVTTEIINGTGAFDVFMRAGSNQLQSQYDKGRIKGADYASAYIQMMELMMTQANMFVLKKFETEMAALLFKPQYLKAAFDAIAAEETVNKVKTDTYLLIEQANKIIKDAYLTSVQSCELPLNSSADRVLKEQQSKAQAKTVDLYDRQITGFDEKNTEGIFKIIMDAWAAQGVEITSNQAESVMQMFKNTGYNPAPGSLDERIKKMMNDNGITL